MSRERIPEAERQRIADAIREGVGSVSVGSLAKRFKRSKDTIRRIAAENGLAHAFVRTATARATRAKQLDNRALRAELGTLLLLDALEERKAKWERAQIHKLDNEGVWQTLVIETPTFDDKAKISQSIRWMIQTHIDMENIDISAGQGSALDRMWDEMEAAQAAETASAPIEMPEPTQ